MRGIKRFTSSTETRTTGGCGAGRVHVVLRPLRRAGARRSAARADGARVPFVRPRGHAGDAAGHRSQPPRRVPGHRQLAARPGDVVAGGDAPGRDRGQRGEPPGHAAAHAGRRGSGPAGPVCRRPGRGRRRRRRAASARSCGPGTPSACGSGRGSRHAGRRGPRSWSSRTSRRAGCASSSSALHGANVAAVIAPCATAPASRDVTRSRWHCYPPAAAPRAPRSRPAAPATAPSRPRAGRSRAAR